VVELLGAVLPCARHTDHKRVQYVAFYLLDDAQLWYHHLELNGGPPTWHHFAELINKRFRPSLRESPIRELALLHCDGPVDDYCNKFALSSRDPDNTEAHQVQLFTVGLRYPLRTDIALQKQPNLDEVVMFARAYEQHNKPPPVAVPSSFWTTSRPPSCLIQ
jgi:hypothetical protein